MNGLKETGLLSNRELWLVGISLYWGEGSKQHEHSPSTGIVFSNSDPTMLKIFLRWLTLMNIRKDELKFELYIHQDRRRETKFFKKWWESTLRVEEITSIYFKKGKRHTNRHAVGDLYHGLVRIKVKNSTSLNRKVHGWIHGISVNNGGSSNGRTAPFEGVYEGPTPSPPANVC